MEQLGEKVAAHEATLGQMNERLGNIEATLREMNGRFDGHFREINSRMATTGELRGWAGVISALLAIAVGVILKYG